MITIWSWIGILMMWIGGLLLGGWLVIASIRRWAPKWEDPAMYAYVFLVGLATYLCGRVA